MKEFMKYPKIYALGKQENEDIFKDNDEIIVQEKMDGANFRFTIKDGKIIFGSRTQQITSDDGEDVNVQKGFATCLKYIRETISFKEYNEGFIYYGECMIKHTMSYDWDNIPRFLGFDIYSIKEGQFMPYAFMEDAFTNLGLKVVPRIHDFDLTKIDDDSIPLTVYPPKADPKKQAEGVVFKNYNKQIFAKYVRLQFKEDNAKTFGGTPKYEETYSGKIAARFATNARIDKCIFKLVDEGNKLDLPLMKQLPTMVYNDIIEEEYKTILGKKEVLDIGKLKKIVTGRCLAVLKQVMVNNALE